MGFVFLIGVLGWWVSYNYYYFLPEAFFFPRREILFDYEQYEYHGTSVSRRFLFLL